MESKQTNSMRFPKYHIDDRVQFNKHSAIVVRVQHRDPGYFNGKYWLKLIKDNSIVKDVPEEELNLN